MQVSMRLNDKLNGIELIFDKRPSDDILQKLGRNGLGFRWHNKNKYWFAKQTPERLAFARQLTGQVEEEKRPGTAVQKPYRYYSTQRPVDLGTYPKAGGAFIGFENFDKREQVENGSFLAWGWLDYSRPLTDSEISDYELRAAPETLRRVAQMDQSSESQTSLSVEQTPEQVPDSNPKQVESSKESNTFAVNYDTIQFDTKIFKSSDVGFFDFRAAYFEDLNLFVQRTNCGDTLSVTSLNNAGKSGKTCERWTFNVSSWPREDVCIKLFNEHQIHTVKDLWDKCLSSQDTRTAFMLDTEDIRLSNDVHYKAVNVFSPFVEVKPLQTLPETWTKKNFCQALMSGQIYAGEIKHHTTDDFQYDASRGFQTGLRLKMPDEALDAVEGWGKSYSVKTVGEPDEKGVYTLTLSEGHNLTKTFWFDLTCDIAEGKRREEGRQAGIRQFNDMMRACCIKADPESIDPERIYIVQTLEENRNTGVLEAISSTVQGFVLQDRLEDGYSRNMLSISPMEIQPDKLYQITNRDHEPSSDFKNDNRFILCGNSIGLVTGKALLELTQEQIYFYFISEPTREYATPEQARETLEKFQRGTSWWGVTGRSADGYAQAIETLDAEVLRAGSGQQLSSLDSMLKEIQTRESNNNQSAAQHAIVRNYADRD